MRELFLHIGVLSEMIPSRSKALKFFVEIRYQINISADMVKCQQKRGHSKLPY